MRLLRSHAIRRPGALLALLAIIALTLLAPVHAVHALQRAADPITVGCHDTQEPEGQARHDAATPSCPVCALAKAAGGLVPPALPGVTPRIATTVPGIIPGEAPAPAARSHDLHQARAPPVLV